ncbi:MAG TPA: hypothetical protein VNE21_05905, partial [Mycobacteriales bacterium]|nr:hypothetical protein [Mycobacteriales bacterium]
GRTSIAYSADGKYLWAVVQDAGTFRGETYEGEPLPASNSVLNGVYVSPTADPSSWIPKGNTTTFGTAAGSGLLAEQGLLYGPGVQSWYDQWIAVDPNDDTRVLVGLEEVYEAVANPYGPGYASWRTVARYWNACAAVTVDCSTVPGPVYAGSTTHPDQHAYAFVPLQNGATLLYTGSDGGVFSQTSHATDLGYTGYDNSSWQGLNIGLSTTQPYYAAEGSDGTIYAGLQDNGEVKIQPASTHGDEVYGGDGFDTAVVPGNSNDVYEEYTYGGLSVSTDGGMNWLSDAPCDSGDSTLYQFATPFVLDPLDANHVVEVGRYIHESTRGVATDSATTSACITGTVGTSIDWSSSYDLGASPVATDPGVGGAGVNNVASAVAVYGPSMYVPFCGACDPISQGHGDFAYFHNGLATNVKAGCVPHIGTGACWHKAAILGLPNRYIQGVALDPRHPGTVYVALSGYLRRWYPNAARGGHVYVSHDAGQHFSDISGNLPDTPANALVLRDGRVYVGTDLGVYTTTQGSARWAKLGTGLPNASVLDLRPNPDGSQLVAALHGRGVWTYAFGQPAAASYQQRGAVPPGTRAGPGDWTVGPAPDVMLIGLMALVAAAGIRCLAGPYRPVPRTG